MTLTIRRYDDSDKPALWRVLEPVFRAGDTYTVDPGINAEAAVAYWCDPAHRTFVAEDDGKMVGTYYLKTNQHGGGAHVCNCGYVTAAAAQGTGVAREMLAHSLDEARRLGYSAMQYNFVVSTNTRAIATWERAGFATFGRLPAAFLHPTAGYVDALVMYRSLV